MPLFVTLPKALLIGTKQKTSLVPINKGKKPANNLQAFCLLAFQLFTLKIQGLKEEDYVTY
jgi:hypothetical protein